MPLWTGIAATVAVAGLLGAGYFFTRSRAARLNPGNAPRIGYLETSTFGRRRHAHSILWNDIEDHSALFLRDLLFTPPDATAYVVLDDLRRISLPPGSMVELDEQTTETLKIQLVEPEKLMIAAVPTSDGLVWFSDPKVWEWRQSELSDRAVKLAGRTLKLASLIPMNRMSRGPLRPVLGDFEVHLLPALPLPRQRTVSLRWTPVPVEGVRYEVHLSDNAAMERPTIRASTSSSLRVPLGRPGNYFWRALAYQGGEALSSEIGAFKVSGNGRVVAFVPDASTIAMVGASGKGRADSARVQGQGRGVSVHADRASASLPGLERAEIDRVVKRRSFEVKACLEGESPSPSSFQGKVFLSFQILPDGGVGDIKIDAGREPSAALSDCVQRKVVRWKFPRPRDGQPVAITYPFVFATIEDR